MGTPSLNSRYLPHINGLRALAILGVLFYHLRAEYCPAGYFGVDLFLVISGFLLFRSLLKPGAAQGFHYGSYLLKKAWRILPSWFVVSLVVCILTAYLFAPSRAGDILKTARYSALFHADYYIDRSCDYFNAFSQQNPLLHYWYLSITQQIYLVAPLLLIPLARWCSRRAAIILLTALSLLSFAYYVLTTSADMVPEALRHNLLSALGTKTAYYHLIPRFWEFAAGFGIFLLPEFAGRPRLRAALGLLGLIGIVASFYLYSTGSPALYLTIICSLFALRYGSTGPAARLLNLRPVQALGTISFSLYLWHWPVMVFWKYCSMDATGLWNELGMVALGLLLAIISWRFIESVSPPSHSGWKGTLLRCCVLLMLPLIAAGASKIHRAVKKQMVISSTALMPPCPPHVETDATVLHGLGALADINLPQPPLRLGVADAEPLFFLMGDSHAYQLSNALHNACEQAGIRAFYLNNNVFPYPGMLFHKTPHDPGCWNREIAARLLQYLGAHPEIRYVVIAQRWEYRLLKTDASHEASGKAIRNESEHLELAAAGLRDWCRSLRALGKEVIVLGDTPSFPTPYPLDEWERYQKLTLLRYLRPYRERYLTTEQHEEEQKHSHQLLHQLESEGLAHYIDVAPGVQENGIYPARTAEGQFLYYDDNHLSTLGVERAINYLMPRLLNIMQKQQP